MKLIKDSDELLEFADRPWLIGLIAVGFGLAIGGTGVLTVLDLHFGGTILVLLSAAIFYGAYRLIEYTRISFSRSDASVEFFKKSLYRTSRTSYPLAGIEGARLEEKKSSGGTSGVSKTLYRVVLTRDENAESLPFTSSFSSGDQYPQIVDTVNNWLSTC